MNWTDDFRSRINLAPGVANLNAGTLSPTPLPVLEAAEALRRKQALMPHDFFFREAGAILKQARTALGDELGAKARDLFLLPNVTWAINLAIRAAERLKTPGRHVVLAANCEYGSLLHAWSQHQASGLQLRFVSVDSCRSRAEILRAFDAALSECAGQALAIYFSHVAQPTGFVLPARDLVELAHRHGALAIIDGAHAPGLLPLDLGKIGADAYGGNLHKWMMAPTGAGFLHVTGALQDALSPLVVSWGAKHLSTHNRHEQDDFFGGTHLQGAVEFHGVTDRIPQMVMPQVIQFWDELNRDRVRARQKELSQYAIKTIGAILEPFVQPDDERQWAMTAFKFEPCDRKAFRSWMWNHDRIAAVTTRLREDVEETGQDTQPQPYFLRVSASWFNTTDDIDRLTHALRALLRLRPREVFPA